MLNGITVARQRVRVQPAHTMILAEGSADHKAASQQTTERLQVLPAERTVLSRLLRFSSTGGSAFLVQIALLTVLLSWHWIPLLANALALIISTQVNYVLSFFFTWPDRRPHPERVWSVLGQWAAYQGMSASSLALNMLVFSGAHLGLHIPPTIASAIGTAAGAVVNYVAGDRIVFRVPDEPTRGAAPLQPTLAPERAGDHTSHG